MHSGRCRLRAVDDTEIARELSEAQAEFDQETRRVRLRRQAAVKQAREAGWSKYKIAATMGIKGPTVDSIISSAERGDS